MNQKNLFPLVFGVISMALLSSCEYRVESELFTPTCETPPNPTYNMEVKTVIDNSCATPACHAPTGDGPGDFTNFSGLEPFTTTGGLEQRVLIDLDMPPSGSLDPCDLELIEKWISLNAPE